MTGKSTQRPPKDNKGHQQPPKATKGHQRPPKATKGTKSTKVYLVIRENTLIWYLRVKGEWLCSVLWSLIHAIWKRLFSIYYWGVADQIWQDCKWELLRELWELQTFPKYWKLCGCQLYQKLLTLLNYWRIQYYRPLPETPAFRYTQPTCPLSICAWLLQFSKLKYQVWWTGFFSYFELELFAYCSLKNSSLK